jgi:hypothetical protein
MTRDEVIQLAEKAGAKVFPHVVVVADDGSSGNATEFIHRFASLLEDAIKKDLLSSLIVI